MNSELNYIIRIDRLYKVQNIIRLLVRPKPGQVRDLSDIITACYRRWQIEARDTLRAHLEPSWRPECSRGLVIRCAWLTSVPAQSPPSSNTTTMTCRDHWTTWRYLRSGPIMRLNVYAAVSIASLYAVTLRLKMMLSVSLSSIVSPGIVTQDTGGVKIWPVV